MCGAGGGGFVACITKNPGDKVRHNVEHLITPLIALIVMTALMVAYSEFWMDSLYVTLLVCLF